MAIHNRKWGTSSIKRSLFCVVLQFMCINAAFAQNVKLAFVGDQGIGEDARAVLELISSENTELLLIQGDLGYTQNAAAIWEQNLNDILGENFPILTVVGNHENFEWPLYKSFAQSRINRVPALTCSGDTGVKAFCNYKGIEIVQVAPGITEVPGVLAQDNYDSYIRDKFSGSKAKWRICSWHKNQNKMQIGTKPSQTGWGVYQACLGAGAIVATGHEHSYSRTFLMDSFENQSVVHTSNWMQLKRGQSIAFVSGMGGRGIRYQSRFDEWWAAVASATQGASHGALFCDFNVHSAVCYFKSIDGVTHDIFTLFSELNREEKKPSALEKLASSLAAMLISLLD